MLLARGAIRERAAKRTLATTVAPQPGPPRRHEQVVRELPDPERENAREIIHQWLAHGNNPRAVEQTLAPLLGHEADIQFTGRSRRHRAAVLRRVLHERPEPRRPNP